MKMKKLAFLALAVASVATTYAGIQAFTVTNDSDYTLTVSNPSETLTVPQGTTSRLVGAYTDDGYWHGDTIQYTDQNGQAHTAKIYAPSLQFSTQHCGGYQTGGWALTLGSMDSNNFACGDYTDGLDNTTYTVVVTNTDVTLNANKRIGNKLDSTYIGI